MNKNKKIEIEEAIIDKYINYKLRYYQYGLSFFVISSSICIFLGLGIQLFLPYGWKIFMISFTLLIITGFIHDLSKQIKSEYKQKTLDSTYLKEIIEDQILVDEKFTNKNAFLKKLYYDNKTDSGDN